MYADNLVLLSASVSVLQKMVGVCEQEMTYLDMKFNTSKSMVLRIGRARKKVCNNMLSFVKLTCSLYQLLNI